MKVDIASFLSNLSMRSSGMSVRSATSTNTVQKARISRRQPKSKTVSDPYLNSRTVWPVTFCEAPFLPEFPIRGKVDENSFQVGFPLLFFATIITHIGKNYIVSLHKAIELISSGAYGKVHKVRKKDTGVVYAMKVMSKSKVVSSMTFLLFEQMLSPYHFINVDFRRRCCQPGER